MIFVGPIVNALVVLVAGLFGALLRRGISEKMISAIGHGLGVSVLIIGIRGAIKSVTLSPAMDEYIEIITVICIVLGAVLGELIDIHKWMNRLGDFLQKKIGSGGGGSRVGEGFVSCTTICCIGAWAITGSMESAIGNPSSLLVKAVVDGVTALVLATTLGWGVSLSALSLLIYQGGFTVLFYFAGAVIPAAAMQAMGIVGSILIIMVALNFLGITRIRVANFIPAVFLPIIASFFFS